MTKSHHNELAISVIMPVYNGGENFRKCLLSLTKATPTPNEIIVVADGGKNSDLQIAKEFGTKILATPLPGGPARARNLGVQSAQGDIVFFIDADVAIAPDAISQIRDAFMQEPDLAAIFGSYDDQPAAPTFLSQYKNLFHHYVHQTGNEEASTFWSGCGAVRREIFLAHGGFDEGYSQPCIEDIELGYRLKQSGHRIRLHKTLQGKHLKRWTVILLLKADFFQRALPWTQLILQDRQLTNDLNLGGSSRTSVVSVYALLGILPGVIWWPQLLVIVAALALILLIINAPIYRFFWKKRGLWFAIKTIPWHWFYYFYGGLAFAIGILLYFLQKRRESSPGLFMGSEETL